MSTSAKISSLDIFLRGNTQNLDSSLDRAGAGLNKFRQTVQTQAQSIDSRLSSIGKGVSGAFQNALMNPISAIQSLASFLGKAFLHPVETAKKSIASLVLLCRGIGDGIFTSLVAPLGMLAGAFATPVNFIGSLFNSLVAVISGVAAAIATAFILPASVIKNIFVGVASAIGSGFKIAFNLVADLFSSLARGAVSSFTILKNAWLGVSSAGGILTAALSTLVGLSTSIGLTPIFMKLGTVVMGLLSPFASLQAAIFGIGTDLAKTFMMVSPVAAFMGHQLLAISPVILSAFQLVWMRLSIMASGLAAMFAPQIQFIKTALTSLWTGLKPILLRVALVGWETVKLILTTLVSIPTNIVMKVWQVGAEAVKAIIAGILQVPSIVLRISLAGWDVVKAAFTSIKANIVGLGSALKTAFNPSAWLSGLKAMASGASGSFTSLAGITGLLSTGIGAVAVAAVAAAAAVAGLGVAGLVMASKQATVIASMQKMATTLGMGVESFSGLASTSGMELEAFGTGLEHLQRTLSETALNGGATAATLASIGLNARELATNPDMQMTAIANALSKINNQADRLRISQELFGRGAGFDFARLLGNGAAGLDELQAKAQRFGLSFTAEQAEIVKRSNKAWGEWSLGLKGIGNSLAIALAPAWEKMGKALGNFFAMISGWVRSALPYFQLLWQAVEAVADGVGDAFTFMFGGVGSTMTGMATAIGEFIQGSVPFVRQLWDTFKAGASLVGEAMSGLWNFIKASFSIAWEFFTDMLKPWWEMIKQGFAEMGLSVGLSFDSWKDFLDAVIVGLITMEFAFKNWRSVWALTVDAIRLLIVKLRLEFARLTDSFVNTINTMIDKYNAVAEKLGMPIKTRLETTSIEDLSAMMQDLQQRLRESGNVLGDDLRTYIAQKMREINAVARAAQTQVRQQNNLMGGAEKKDNAAAEKGSVEAFKIIAGDKADKQFVVLNDILKEMRQERELTAQQLRELRARVGVAVARL